jgi:hypothetical protein
MGSRRPLAESAAAAGTLGDSAGVELDAAGECGGAPGALASGDDGEAFPAMDDMAAAAAAAVEYPVSFVGSLCCRSCC